MVCRWLVCGLVLGLIACGKDRPPVVDGGGGMVGGGGQLGLGGQVGTGGIDGFAGHLGTGGEGGQVSTCGDDHVDPGEDCDGLDLRGRSCRDFDFHQGDLRWTSACTWDTSDCSLVEVCDNGTDDDGDGLVDCEDPDCQDAPEACPRCGDGIINGEEACDGDAIVTSCEAEGFATGTVSCTETCTLDLGACLPPESCDNGEDDDGDGLIDCADPDCKQVAPCPVCGNGIVEAGEQCDDGNQLDGDGCAVTCEVENAWLVPQGVGETDQRQGQLQSSGPLYQRMRPDCVHQHGGMYPYEFHYLLNPGSGMAEVQVEASWSFDGFLFAYAPTFDPLEPRLHCQVGNDDHNGIWGSRLEVSIPGGAGVWIVATTYNTHGLIGGYTLTARTLSLCGDGVLQGQEACDQGDADDGDGCSSACRLEFGWDCDASSCWPITCGDGIVEGGEECDDGNTDPLDGCSATCEREGHTCADPLLLHQHEVDATHWELSGSTTGFGDDWTASCFPISRAPDRFVRFEAPAAAVYAWEVDASPYTIITTVLDDTCSSAGEISCQSARNSNLPPRLTEGRLHLDEKESIHFVVELDGIATGSMKGGPFTLRMQKTRCGDGVKDADEWCDDGNQDDTDGCTHVCTFSPVQEVEPNGSQATATPIQNLGVGGLLSAGDVDVFRFPVIAGTTYLVATSNLPNTPVCDWERVDTALSIHDDAGNLIAFNDDAVPGVAGCSEVTFTAPSTGSLYATVEAGATLAAIGFGIEKYHLWIVPQ